MRITKELNDFAQKEASRRGLEKYRVFQQRTITELAQNQPTSKKQLQEVYGLGEKKIQKYGEDILSIIAGDADSSQSGADTDTQPSVLSVGEFIKQANETLRSLDVRVKGEIVERNASNSGHFYSEIKDPDSGAVLRCFISKHVYELSGVEIVEGVEIVCDGYPTVHEKYGFSFQVQAIEVAGQGALKAEYEKLKKELTEAGVFAEENKRELPKLPQTIGVITSRTGAVIDDIRNNLGSYGFDIQLYDARVEGKRALHDLVEAMEYFQRNPVDVIVIGRGGGSLEALQAFNSEALVRAVEESDIPVLACVGHDKDVPLTALAADKAASTPTGAAVLLRESWQKAETWLKEQSHRRLTDPFSNQFQQVKSRFQRDVYTLRSYISRVDGYIENLSDRYLRAVDVYLQTVRHEFRQLIEKFLRSMDQWRQVHANLLQSLDSVGDKIVDMYERQLQAGQDLLAQSQKSIEANNPRRLLERGYSIVTSQDQVVKSAQDVSVGDEADIRVENGIISTTVDTIQVDQDE